MRKIYPVITFLAFTSVQAALIEYDGFDYSIGAGAPPGWVNDGDPDHASIDAGSLSFPDYTPSTGNQMGLGHQTGDYLHSFAPTDLAVGETVYFSILFHVDEPESFGNQHNAVFRLYDANDASASGVSLGIDSDDGISMGFSVDNRNRGYSHVDAVSGPQEFDINGVYLVVGGYTRGSTNGNGSVDLWINPDSSSFGDTAPTPYLSEASYQSDSIWNTFEIASAGSSSLPTSWTVDEFRVGTDWASIVPSAIPEPSTYAILFGVVVATVATMRRRR